MESPDIATKDTVAFGAITRMFLVGIRRAWLVPLRGPKDNSGDLLKNSYCNDAGGLIQKLDIACGACKQR